MKKLLLIIMCLIITSTALAGGNRSYSSLTIIEKEDIYYSITKHPSGSEKVEQESLRLQKKYNISLITLKQVLIEGAEKLW